MKDRGVMAWTGFYVACALFVLFALFPYYWIFISSLKSAAALNAATTTLLPTGATLGNYTGAFTTGGFGRALLNSIIVAGSATILATILGGLGAYALARMRIRGRTGVLGFFLIVGFFPQIGIVGPLFLIFRTLNILDTYQSLIFPYLILTMPIVIWLLHSYFGQIPYELEEAAFVDGATRLQTMVRIIAPLAAPGVFTAVIIAFILAWNDLLFALSFITSPDLYTAPLAIVNFRGAYYINFGEIDAGVIVTSIPIAVLVLLFQRRIISGLTAGGLKG